MSVSTESQLEAIHAMMAKGQRSVRIESHTLLIWGLSAAALTIFLEFFFPEKWITERKWLVLIETAIIVIVLTAAGFADYQFTRSARRRRGETISFVQRQVTKTWWFLVGLIVFIEVGMSFFGGGFLFHAVVLVILGIAFYVQGLFSENMLAWIGVTLIVLGIGSLALQMPPHYSRWLLITVLGAGFPLLAYANTKAFFYQSGFLPRLGWCLSFLLLMILPLLPIYWVGNTQGFSNAQPLNMTEYAALDASATHALHTVNVPAGMDVPVYIEIQSPVLEGGVQQLTVPLKIAKDIRIAVRNEKPTGFFQVQESAWQEYGHSFRLHVEKWEPTFDRAKGPRLDIQLKMSTNR